MHKKKQRTLFHSLKGPRLEMTIHRKKLYFWKCFLVDLMVVARVVQVPFVVESNSWCLQNSVSYIVCRCWLQNKLNVWLPQQRLDRIEQLAWNWSQDDETHHRPVHRNPVNRRLQIWPIYTTYLWQGGVRIKSKKNHLDCVSITYPWIWVVFYIVFFKATIKWIFHLHLVFFQIKFNYICVLLRTDTWSKNHVHCIPHAF